MKGVKDERAKNFHFDCFVVKGIIYTIGGSLTGNNDFVRTVEAYDPFRAPKRPSLDTDAKKFATLWGKIRSTN